MATGTMKARRWGRVPLAMMAMSAGRQRYCESGGFVIFVWHCVQYVVCLHCMNARNMHDISACTAVAGKTGPTPRAACMAPCHVKGSLEVHRPCWLYHV